MLWIVVAVFLSIVAIMMLSNFLAFAEPPNWLSLIKDGQLCWISMMLGFIAMFDASSLGAPNGASDDINYFALLVIFSAFIAVLGFIEPVSITIPPKTRWYRHFVILLVSIFTTIFVITGYAKKYLMVFL